MTATEELRRLLDERGVEWEAPTSFDGTARYDTTAGGYWFHEFDGKITIHGLTPEQAIAAMLGADAKPTQDESSGTCHNKGSLLYFVCSGCGASPLVIRPHYCPNCGRKVVNE